MHGQVAGEWEMRAMTPEDLPDVLALAHATGRNLHRSEYERFLPLEGARGLVVRRGGELEGAVTSIRYFDHAFLGPVLMRAGHDAVGIAMVLLQHAVEELQRNGVGHVEAEAGPEEEVILGGMGFERLRGTVVLERPAAQAGTPPHHTLPMRVDHLLDIGELDAGAVGWGRKQYLLALSAEFPDGARVAERDGEVAGYAMVRRSRRGYHLGPLVTRGDDRALAARLLDDAVASVPGWPIVTLAHEDDALLAELARVGFAPVGRLARMRAGAPSPRAGAAEAKEWLVGSRITG